MVISQNDPPLHEILEKLMALGMPLPNHIGWEYAKDAPDGIEAVEWGLCGEPLDKPDYDNTEPVIRYEGAIPESVAAAVIALAAIEWAAQTHYAKISRSRVDGWNARMIDGVEVWGHSLMDVIFKVARRRAGQWE